MFILGFIAVLTAIIFQVMAAYAQVDWVLYIARAIAFLEPCITTCARAHITKLVSPFEIGAVFAVVGAFQVRNVPPVSGASL